MKKNNFNNKKHADDLLDIEHLIVKTFMLCKGMELTCDQMSNTQYKNATAGAFGLMSYALDKALDLIAEAESDFRLSHNCNIIE